ncbi:DUF3152 domain-containing protein [Streptomyces sp. NPDC050704]|uniref:DUF3152 domain-containing protein n=1 Tax=Streptomyces sp. NPDC050704 TaxID=3157219 RepID=UPI00343F50C4
MLSLLSLVVALAMKGTGPLASGADDGSTIAARPSPPTPERSAKPSGDTAAGPDGKSGGTADAEANEKGDPSTDPAPSSSSSSSPSSSSSSSRSSSPSIPLSGPGTFTTAGGGSGTVGKGSRLLRYEVVVEDGLTQSAADVARQVEGVLADPRGWTADGRSGFRRVSSGTSDFVVRLATPGTVDEICGRYGLDTGGEVNCSVGKDVVVNLKRWLLATPVYADDVDAYRALIINHEVGHFLGHGHVTCPGAGKPAPAMMQQIKGMRGCVPNVWPYDSKGRLITGPAVP